MSFGLWWNGNESLFFAGEERYLSETTGNSNVNLLYCSVVLIRIFSVNLFVVRGICFALIQWDFHKNRSHEEQTIRGVQKRCCLWQRMGVLF